MSGSAPRLAGTDDVRLDAYPIELRPGQRVCQSGETVPADAAVVAFRVGTERQPGPPLRVTVGGGPSVVIAEGYRDASAVRAPVPDDVAGPATVCIANAGERRVFLGGQTNATELPAGLAAQVDGAPAPALVQLRYFRDGSESRWAVAGSALRRWGYVTALGGATPWLAIALFAAAWLSAVALALRGRVSVRACFAVALASAAGWAMTTPALHVPDEPQHLAYAQYLAETGKLPRPISGAVFSAEEAQLFAGVRFNQVAGNRDGRPPWTAERSAQVESAIVGADRLSDGASSNTTNNPPLYYAAEALPYWLGSGRNLLDRLLLMRLLSAVLAGLTAAFVLLCVREVLPGAPWAAGAGALAFAVSPLFGFISGGVNNDAGLFAASAALLWLVARALRRGLDARTAAGIGAAFGLGLVTKATMLGFAPGLIVVAAILLRRSRAAEERVTLLKRIAAAAGVAAAPVIAYVALNRLTWDRPLWSGGVAGTPAGDVGSATPNGFVSYLWQFYLPQLPFMDDQQTGLPLFNVWFKGLIGRYGWLDTVFPARAYDVAAILFAGILALAARAAWHRRDRVRARLPELAAYATLCAGLLLLIGWAGYQGRLSDGNLFEQARYLLPLGAFYAGVVALAARGAGPRLERGVASALVVVACGHALLSVLLVAGRFYG